MLVPKLSLSVFLVLTMLAFLHNRPKKTKKDCTSSFSLNIKSCDTPRQPAPIVVKKSIPVKSYFKFIDSLVTAYDSVTNYPLSEHLLVRANPWIIEALKQTDYYYLKSQGEFVYDQKNSIVLHQGDSIFLPDATLAKSILQSFKNTLIDVNIPEFSLRIMEKDSVLYEFLVRVGRPEKKFLKMGNRITDLRTKTGTGTIINHVRNPHYYNPVNGHEYYQTTRDDLKVTALPQIPFLETEINGQRNGQLIHPTTNPETLGKAYSNGCIGTKEADAWVIYYHAPIGTKITIRYDLTVEDSIGNQIDLKDIYHLF